MSWFIRTCRSSLGQKTIMALTGTMLGVFLLVHAAGNSSIFWGSPAFNSYARHLHGLGFLVTIAELVLAVIFVLHVSTGILLTLRNRNARADRYAVHRSAGGRTWGSRTMIWTGLTILAFIILHLINFHFVPHDRPIADIVSPILGNPVYSLVYGLAMLAVGLHLSHGFWSVFQTLGINHPRYNILLRGISWAGCMIIAAVFLAVLILLVTTPGHLS